MKSCDQSELIPKQQNFIYNMLRSQQIAAQGLEVPHSYDITDVSQALEISVGIV